MSTIQNVSVHTFDPHSGMKSGMEIVSLTAPWTFHTPFPYISNPENASFHAVYDIKKIITQHNKWMKCAWYYY
jgi:hypothetical protein